MLLQVFDHLELHDQLHLILIQATCTAFRQLIKSKPSALRNGRGLGGETEDHPPAVSVTQYRNDPWALRDLGSLHLILEAKFGPLFDKKRRLKLMPTTTSTSNFIERSNDFHRIIDFNSNAAETLPWAATPVSRELYLRPDASWRRLHIVSDRRNPTPIRRLDLFFVSELLGVGVHLKYRRADIFVGLSLAGLTMGHYFDLLTYTQDTPQDWEVVPGKKLWSRGEWDMVGTQGSLHRNERVAKKLLVDDPSAATIFVTSLRGRLSFWQREQTDVWWPEPAPESRRLQLKAREECGPDPPPREDLVDKWEAYCEEEDYWLSLGI